MILSPGRLRHSARKQLPSSAYHGEYFCEKNQEHYLITILTKNRISSDGPEIKLFG